MLNRDILAAVLSKWLEPLVMDLAKTGLGKFPMVQSIESTVRNLGWVGVNWSLSDELSPFMNSFTKTMVEPLISQKLSVIPDNRIPTVANSIVDDALAKGELSLFDGKVTFTLEDLQRLKKLLHYNLVEDDFVHYEVKEDEQ